MAIASKAIKKRRFDSHQQQVYLSLWRTYDRLRAIEDELFGSLDLTPQQYNVLRLLETRHPESIPTLQLSSRLISRAPDITRMLDKLEKCGLIARTRSTEDRRAVLVGITEAGLQLVGQLLEPVKRMHVAQVGHLTVEQMRVLCDLLSLVREPHESDSSEWKTALGGSGT